MKNIINVCKKPIILVLDSGVGGLSIYTAIYNLLPDIYYLYFFDNEKFPYGTHSETFIIKRIILILEIIQKKHNFDLVIIACNTASVVALKIIRKHFKFPILGILPKLKLATQLTKNGVIGILATHRTIKHRYISKLIKNFSLKYQIMTLESTQLVNLAEKKIHGDEIKMSEYRNILTPWLTKKNIPDTIILGCTHFFFLRKELIKILPKNSHLIDFRYTTAKKITKILKKIKPTYICQPHITHQNKAYCSLNNTKINTLRPILTNYYHFFSLEILPI